MTIQQEHKYLRLTLLLLLGYGVGFFIMAFLQTPNQMAWYRSLNLPTFMPASVVFSIVWTILYFLISYSAYLVWMRTSHRLFYFQYFAQIVWSYTFFVRHWLWGGFFAIICLTMIVLLVVIQFSKQSKLAGLIMLPYLVWCLYASFLNLATAWIN